MNNDAKKTGNGERPEDKGSDIIRIPGHMSIRSGIEDWVRSDDTGDRYIAVDHEELIGRVDDLPTYVLLKRATQDEQIVVGVGTGCHREDDRSTSIDDQVGSLQTTGDIVDLSYA